MYSIGEVAQMTGIKVPTIRYYEGRGLVEALFRSHGNQRRYGRDELQKLSFIKHARELGIPIDAVASLLELQTQDGARHETAHEIAYQQLEITRAKICRLQNLERELARITKACDERNPSLSCNIVNAIADHSLCDGEHGAG